MTLSLSWFFLRHEPWSDRGWWRRVIELPYSRGDADSAAAMQRLRDVLAPMLLQRTKNMLDANGSKIVELPPKVLTTVRIALSERERSFYAALKARAPARKLATRSPRTSRELGAVLACFGFLRSDDDEEGAGLPP